MDNASKALIMAGAILIAVALVGVGVYLYSSAAGMMNSGVSELASADMMTKNSKIELYEGTVTGTELKALMRTLNSYNENDVFPAPVTITCAQVTVNATTGLMTDNSIGRSTKYTVTLGYDNAGWVNAVTATKVN